MTALLAALDPRVHAIGVACYLTSFDTLLPALGPQDAEQSIPNFIASGLDFPDWVELAAPRPYAIISTAQDMFPYAGALATATEARRFYALFDPASDGHCQPTTRHPGIPTGPTLNPDTSNTIPATAALQWITGIGRHGNLGPITATDRLLLPNASSPLRRALPSFRHHPRPAQAPSLSPASLPKDALQVTPTGQVSTSYPDSETVHTLTLKRYATLPKPKPLTPPATPADHPRSHPRDRKTRRPRTHQHSNLRHSHRLPKATSTSATASPSPPLPASTSRPSSTALPTVSIPMLLVLKD